MPNYHSRVFFTSLFVGVSFWTFKSIHSLGRVHIYVLIDDDAPKQRVEKMGNLSAAQLSRKSIEDRAVVGIKLHLKDPEEETAPQNHGKLVVEASDEGASNALSEKTGDEENQDEKGALSVEVEAKKEYGASVVTNPREAPLASETKSSLEPVTEPATNMQDLERLFYKNHYQTLKDVSAEKLLYWQAAGRFLAPSVTLFGPLLDRLPNLYKIPGHKWRKHAENIPNNTQYLYFDAHPGLCHAAKLFDEWLALPVKPYTFPHVIIVHLFEDHGGFSSHISGKTGKRRISLPNGWESQGCTEKEVFRYLDHPHTHAVVTAQWHAYDHPKVHSLPLGIQLPRTAKEIEKRIRKYNPDISRSQLLMVNSKARKMRAKMLDRLITRFNEDFNVALQNTYGRRNLNEYFQEISESKFILSPTGTGIDCYRNWEALSLGCIPVIETVNRTDGWFRTFERLPVAMIDSFDNLTPMWLEQEYERIIQSQAEYQWDRLTLEFWINWFFSLSRNVTDVQPYALQ